MYGLSNGQIKWTDLCIPVLLKRRVYVRVCVTSGIWRFVSRSHRKDSFLKVRESDWKWKVCSHCRLMSIHTCTHTHVRAHTHMHTHTHTHTHTQCSISGKCATNAVKFVSWKITCNTYFPDLVYICVYMCMYFCVFKQQSWKLLLCIHSYIHSSNNYSEYLLCSAHYAMGCGCCCCC